MRSTFRTVAIAFLTSLVTFGSITNGRLAVASNTNQSGKRASALETHDLWRKLWEDHITWTRVVIIGVLDNLPGVSAYEARLLQNYEDMEDALRPYYGDNAERLGDLVKDHLLIAVDILTAARTGNTNALSQAVARWYENAQDIAKLMAELNPKFWPLSEGGPMWRDHLDATLDEAVKHLTGDFAGEVAAYDKVHSMALDMADFISNGIMGQFQHKFTKLRQ